MTGAAGGLAGHRAIAYFVAAIEFVVTAKLADLVVAITFVLALGLRVVASIGASCREQSCDNREKK